MKIHPAALVVVAVVLFAAGMVIGLYNAPKELKEFLPIPLAEDENIDNSGFIPANVSITGTSIIIRNNCNGIGFDVTSDQAYSISNALQNSQTVRPLTHDMLKDVMENFNISVLAVRIEKWENDIYYARMFVQQGPKILDLDIRPSDAIAMSLRTGKQLLINQSMLFERGEIVC